MLSKAEKREFKKILEKCSTDDIYSLCDTSTSKAIDPVNRREAEDAIILYNDSASQLLKRQKLKRECLLMYLKETGIDVSTNSTKADLVQKILTMWSLQVARPSVPPSPAADFKLDFTSPKTPSRVEVDFPESSPVSRIRIDYSPPESSRLTKPHCSEVVPSVELAEKFTSWYYCMLNSYNAFVRNEPSEEFGVQHFFEDCSLNIEVMGSCETHDFLGAQNVVNRSLAMVRDEGLIFNPSHSAEKKDPHGLLVVTVAGTVHRKHEFMGVFEQCFGLVNNPLTGRLVIKFTMLKIKQGRQCDLIRQQHGQGNGLTLMPFT